MVVAGQTVDHCLVRPPVVFVIKVLLDVPLLDFLGRAEPRQKTNRHDPAFLLLHHSLQHFLNFFVLELTIATDHGSTPEHKMTRIVIIETDSLLFECTVYGHYCEGKEDQNF